MAIMGRSAPRSTGQRPLPMEVSAPSVAVEAEEVARGDHPLDPVRGSPLTSALVALIAFRSSRRSAASRTGSPRTVSASRVAAVTLEIDEADPASPAVRRLVQETARGIFRTAPDAREVVVRTRAGTILGRVSRETPMPRELTVSPVLHEPHVRRTHVPDVLGGLYGSEPAPRPDRDRHTPGELAPPHRPLMDQFDLPEAVRTGIRDPDDPIDLVRAILEAAGVPCEIDGDLIRVGESALVILRTSGDVVIGHEALNHAYLRVVRSGAATRVGDRARLHGSARGQATGDAGSAGPPRRA